MKADPEVKMISAEAPILFAKGCDIFITELTMRAWIHAEENKRRTLQRSDIASALAKSDMFDFLIDIVPREEASSHAKRATGQSGPNASGVPAAPGGPQIPGQHGALPQAANSSHPMGATDYSLGGHGLAPEQDYRPAPNMYSGQVQPGPSAPYGQAPAPMYGEMESMYTYSTMQAQQVSRSPGASASLPVDNFPRHRCQPKILNSFDTLVCLAISGRCQLA
jgi:nuclear transcription factor Y, gamma